MLWICETGLVWLEDEIEEGHHKPLVADLVDHFQEQLVRRPDLGEVLVVQVEFARNLHERILEEAEQHFVKDVEAELVDQVEHFLRL